jgi:hypothetical protein
MKYLLCLTYGLFIFLTFNAYSQGNIKFDYKNSLYHCGDKIQFHNISSNKLSDSTFYWEFGEDCGISPVYDPKSCSIEIKGLKSVTHTYQSAGKYKVRLSTATGSYSEFIEILPKEEDIPSFTAKESFDNNLINNSGFEAFVKCPDKPGQLYNTTKWYSPTPSTPDYFNSCYTDKTVYDWKIGVPANFAGNSPAKEGNAYAGILNYIVEDTVASIQVHPGSKYYNYREYLETKLNKPLITGQTYAVQFYIKLSSKSRVSTSIGLLLSKNEVKDTISMVLSDLNPQLNLNSTSDTGWVLLADTFVADDSYEYLIIGNFKDDQNCNLKDIRPDSIICSKYGNFKAFASYCYIDAVVVSNIFNERQERFTIATSGGTFSAKDVQIDFTVGQRAVQTLATTSVICTQGFQQPDENDLTFRLLPANSIILNTIEISAYPNPFNRNVRLEITNKLQNDVFLEVYDLFGKKHYSEFLHIPDEQLFSYQLNLEFLPAGIYTLIISNTVDIGTYKLVKQ